jgi:hypothetical protein
MTDGLTVFPPSSPESIQFYSYFTLTVPFSTTTIYLQPILYALSMSQCMLSHSICFTTNYQQMTGQINCHQALVLVSQLKICPKFALCVVSMFVCDTTQRLQVQEVAGSAVHTALLTYKYMEVITHLAICY